MAPVALSLVLVYDPVGKNYRWQLFSPVSAQLQQLRDFRNPEVTVVSLATGICQLVIWIITQLLKC